MERTPEEKMEIANTILAQLGGGKFKVMTGAKHIFAIESGLSFKIPGTYTKHHINFVQILLEPSDTYRMKFYKVRGREVRLMAEHSMIYDDMLQRIFTAETGLDTHL